MVPIPAELVAAALSEGALALLAPQPLTLRLSLHPTGEPNYPFARWFSVPAAVLPAQQHSPVVPPTATAQAATLLRASLPAPVYRLCQRKRTPKLKRTMRACAGDGDAGALT